MRVISLVDWMDEMDYNYVKSTIRSIPDYPKKGILFRDITTLLKDKKAFSICIDALADWAKEKEIDYLVGIEARGFIVGAALAVKLGIGFVPIRKKGKLPYQTICTKYQLEYGEEEMEIHKDAIEEDSSVIIVDDLLATGGTVRAAADLVEKVGGKVAGLAFIIELSELGGRKKIEQYDTIALIKY